jgi:hypothetical protein
MTLSHVPGIYTTILLLYYVILCVDLEHANDHLQVEEISANRVTARHLKFTIVSGYDHFVSVHRVRVDGSASHEQ